jgi:phage terminase small subunit
MVSLTGKQETFARAYVETGNASEAYRTAYIVKSQTKPEPIWQESSRLLANPKVSARVAELHEAAKQLTLVSVESLTLELEEARQLAMADEKGASAAVAAVMGKAKLHGLLIEKNEHTGKGGAPIEVRSLADFYSDLKPSP